MKTLSSAKLLSVQPFEIGQVWIMDGSKVAIVHVGKRLVHYKHTRGEITRGPSLISPKAVLEKLLKARKAVLLQDDSR